MSSVLKYRQYNIREKGLGPHWLRNLHDLRIRDLHSRYLAGSSRRGPIFRVQEFHEEEEAVCEVLVLRLCPSDRHLVVLLQLLEEFDTCAFKMLRLSSASAVFYGVGDSSGFGSSRNGRHYFKNGDRRNHVCNKASSYLGEVCGQSCKFGVPAAYETRRARVAVTRR